MQSSTSLIKVISYWLLALMLVVAAFVVTMVLLNSNVYSAEQQVRNYLSALEEGDGAKALGLLNAKVPEGDASMLAGAGMITGYQKISEPSVENAQSTGHDRATVKLNYTVDGHPESTDFTLRKTGTVWGVFSTWEFVETTLPTVQARIQNESSLIINGVRMNAESGNTTFPVFYPAVYQASFQSEYFDGSDSAVTVTSRKNSSARLTVQLTPTETLRKQTSERINEYLDSCASQDVLAPTDCPFQAQVDRVGGPITWSITKYPEVQISADGSNWVVKQMSGTAQLKTTSVDLRTGEQKELEQDVPFQLGATVQASGEEISVNPVVK